MRWRGRRQSENVDDRRQMAGPVAMGGGLGLMLLALIFALLGQDPRPLLQQAGQQQMEVGENSGQPLTPEEIEAGEFAKTIFADAEDVWTDLFRRAGYDYRQPTLVLFRDRVDSGCGPAASGSGPFYCPADQRVYLDTSFFTQLANQLGAPGEFAQAYVIAHEVGHHVQHLLGYTKKVEAARRQLSESQANRYSVALELQADFFAGVMLHHADRKYSIIEPGDIEAGLNAAKMIGDDTLQMRSRGYIQPETFSHGTSEQRYYWFAKGLKTGDLSQSDTFGEMGL